MRIPRDRVWKFGKSAPAKRIWVADYMAQDDKISGVYHCIPGVHLEIFEHPGELVVCCQLVEYWRYDCDTTAGNRLSILLHLGPQERERESEDAMKD
jgi:hypothetical protein